MTKLNSGLFPKTCSSHILSKCLLLHCLIFMSGPSANSFKVYSEPDRFFPPPLLSPWSCPLCILPRPSRQPPGLCAPHSLSYMQQGDTEYLYQVTFLSCSVPSCGAISHSKCQCSFHGLCKALDPCMICPCYFSTWSFYPAHSAPATLASGPLHFLSLPGTLFSRCQGSPSSPLVFTQISSPP